MTSAGIAEISTIDLAAIAPGKPAIVAGKEVSASDASAEIARLAEAFGADLWIVLATAHLVSDLASAVGRQLADKGERDRWNIEGL